MAQTSQLALYLYVSLQLLANEDVRLEDWRIQKRTQKSRRVRSTIGKITLQKIDYWSIMSLALDLVGQIMHLHKGEVNVGDKAKVVRLEKNRQLEM
jgi:hypothetical protein